MKAFIITLIVLFAIIMFVTANSLYLTSRLDQLLSLCDKAENGSYHALNEMLTQLEDCRFILSISVNAEELDKLDLAISRLVRYHEHDDSTEFAATLNELRASIITISKAQRFSVENIL